MSSLDVACKRLLDIALSCAGMLVGAPLMAVIVLGLKLEERGPVIFTQERVGHKGKRFPLYKFRKFPTTWGDHGPGVTARGDVRMTPLGRVLERSKLDELPQLWNIFKGEMSFVGPRPETPRFADLFTGEYAQVLDFKPGIFGPNQIHYRNEAEMYPPDTDPEVFYRSDLFPAKAKNDLAYFGRACCWKDVGWIVRGLWVSVLGAVNWKRFAGLHLPIVGYDVMATVAAWGFAWMIRFDFMKTLSEVKVGTFWSGLPIILGCTIAALILGGCYRHSLRAFCMSDALRLVSVSFMAWVAAFLIVVGLVDRNTSFLLLPFGWLILITLLALPRVWRRLRWERERQQVHHPDDCRRVLLYGIGRFGAGLSSWMSTAPAGICLVGCIDDDPNLRGRMIRGCTVLGSERDIPLLHVQHPFDEIWVTFVPDEHKDARLQLVAEKLSCRLFVIPSIPPFAVDEYFAETCD